MRTLFCLIILLSAYVANAQNIFVLNDRTGLVSESAFKMMAQKLENKGFILSDSMDMKSGCDYLVTTIYKKDEEFWLLIDNCYLEQYGPKSLGKGLAKLQEAELSVVLTYNMAELVQSGAKASRLAKQTAVVQEPKAETAGKAETEEPKETEETEEEAEVIVPLEDRQNEHQSRYFFAPTSMNLKKGELYVNTNYFVAWDAQYGFTDRFSFGMGTTLGLFPMYFTPKYSIPFKNPKHHVSIGDIFILGTWGTNMLANIAFATYTYGTDHNNITIGGGWMLTNENNLTSTFSAPVVNLSFMKSFSPYISLLSESYFAMPTTSRQRESWIQTDPNWGNGEVMNYTEVKNNQVFTGFFGFRFTGRKKGLSALQVGIVYYRYKTELAESTIPLPEWDGVISRQGNLALPSLSFTHKFGLNY